MAELRRTSKIRVEEKEKSEKGTVKCMELQKSHPLVRGEKRTFGEEERCSWAQHPGYEHSINPFDKRFHTSFQERTCPK